MTRRRVAVVSSSRPPFPGHPVTGGGLRTAQLIDTLRADKHSVIPVIERAALPKEGPPEAWRTFADDAELAAVLREIKPQVIVLEQWALATRLGDPAQGGAPDVPLVIDLHGSLLLENVYRRGAIDLTMDGKAKLEALRRADLLLTPAPAQLHHFGSWAALAGFDPRELPLELLPLASSRVSHPRAGGKPALRMVYGGARWPWIDSLDWLQAAADVAEAHAGARLDVFTYEPPRHGLPFEEDLGSWPEVDSALAGRTRKGVRLRGQAEHSEFVTFLESEATVALDLWEPNPERMLASTTRTIEFLAAGLPVVTVRGASWAEELVQSGAGWTVAPGDREGLRSLLDSLVAEPARIAEASAAALELASQRADLRTTGAALLDFVQKPSRPPRAPRSIVESIVHVRQQHLDETLRSQKAAHRAEHEALVAAHKADTARIRAEHDEEIAALRTSRQEEVAALKAAADAQVALITQRHRDEVDQLRAREREAEATRQAELESLRSEPAARSNELRLATEARDELQGRWKSDRAQDKEARSKLEVELRAQATAREQELRAQAAAELESLRSELQGQLDAMAARKVVRLADAVQSGLGGRAAPDGGRIVPAARLAKLWVEHALDRERD